LHKIHLQKFVKVPVEDETSETTRWRHNGLFQRMWLLRNTTENYKSRSFVYL